MILAISIFALTLAGKLAFDYKLHLAGKKINHKKEAVIVFILLVVASFFTWNIFVSLPCFLFIFWGAMDFGFGLLIARNPIYLGDSSFLDRLQKRYLLLHIMKYIFLQASVLILIYA